MMNNMIKRTILVITGIVLIVCLFSGCKSKSAVSVKAKRIKYEGTYTVSQILADESLSMLFADIIDENSNAEYDLYHFDLKVHNNTDYFVASCYNNKVIDVDNKEYLVTDGRDLKSTDVLFSPDVKYLGLSERYSIHPHRSELLDYFMLLKKGQKPKFKAVYYCLAGDYKKRTETLVYFK